MQVVTLDDNRQSETPGLRRAAMDHLARREHSRQELIRKLKTRFPDSTDESIEAVIDRLVGQGLQSDERFTEAWVRHRKLRGYGYLFILQDLRTRGVPQAVIDRHLFADDSDWSTQIRELIHRRLPADGRLSWGSKQHRRLHALLQRRGFDTPLIQASLKPHLMSAGKTAHHVDP